MRAIGSSLLLLAVVSVLATGCSLFAFSGTSGNAQAQNQVRIVAKSSRLNGDDLTGETVDLNAGDTVQLSAQAFGTYLEFPKPSVSWVGTDDTVATVSSDGELTCVAAGELDVSALVTDNAGNTIGSSVHVIVH